LSSHSCHSYYSIYVLLPSSYSSSSPAPAPTETYTLSLHDALPISSTYDNAVIAQGMLREERPEHKMKIHLLDSHTYSMVFGWYEIGRHTSELQSRFDLVCRLLLEKINKIYTQIYELLFYL